LFYGLRDAIFARWAARRVAASEMLWDAGALDSAASEAPMGGVPLSQRSNKSSAWIGSKVMSRAQSGVNNRRVRNRTSASLPGA
jgi:hypothetical protein